MGRPWSYAYRIIAVVIAAGAFVALLVWDPGDEDDPPVPDPESTCYVGAAADAPLRPLGSRNGPECRKLCTGCGCQGGPGYRRRSDARCVSFDHIRQGDCGPVLSGRDTETCTAECAPLEVEFACETPREE